MTKQTNHLQQPVSIETIDLEAVMSEAVAHALLMHNGQAMLYQVGRMENSFLCNLTKSRLKIHFKKRSVINGFSLSLIPYPLSPIPYPLFFYVTLSI